MLRRLLAAIAVMALFVGGLLAAEGVVVSYSKGSLVVKVDGKEKTYKVGKKAHVHDADGKEVTGKGRAGVLKAGVKVEIEEEDGKVKEVKVKK
jgi:hypothetical protein